MSKPNFLISIIIFNYLKKLNQILGNPQAYLKILHKLTSTPTFNPNQFINSGKIPFHSCQTRIKNFFQENLI